MLVLRHVNKYLTLTQFKYEGVKEAKVYAANKKYCYKFDLRHGYHHIDMHTGADPGFQVRGRRLKKMRRAEGGAKIFGVFRVKNHDFTPKKIIFFPILGGGGRPLDPPLAYISSKIPGFYMARK